MWTYLLKRLLMMVPTVLGVLTFAFLVTQFVPGGPVEHALGQIDHASARAGADGGPEEGGWSYSGRKGIDARQVEELSALYGFDKPPLERYLMMVGNFLTFDLGESHFHEQSVTSLLRAKLGVSVALGVWTFLLTYLIAVPLGVAKAVREGSRFDVATTILVLLGYAVPSFVLGVLLIVLFGGGSFWDIFPLGGLVSEDWHELSLPAKILDYLWHIALPVTAAVVSNFAIKALMTKNTFLDELGKQYVLTARAKGLSERQVLWKHVFRNALLPMITAFPITFIGAFFTGSLLIERLFSLDGLGLLAYESIVSRDFPVVLGALYMFTLVGLAIKLLADLAYVLVDPRIKYSAEDI
ncbi:peptide/nickel transport system permease protein/microcin C transport system permease protein [Sphingomonas zeicaulis]|uniref:microcin C ABC transporter permease YejB n=1 Tax=Sphingomonas zeicaulis TaxID=1632740 RepID=UPI003D1B43C5